MSNRMINPTSAGKGRNWLHTGLLLTAMMALLSSVGAAQNSQSQREAANILRETEAFRMLPSSGPFKDRLGAYQAFVDEFPGSQLGLRVMRDICAYYMLQEKRSGSDPMQQCAEWMRKRLSAPEYAWRRYAQASDSLVLDRIETQLMYAKTIANLKDSSGRGRYEEALSTLAEILVEGESRPTLWSMRPDLKEQIDFARCWCFHGQKEEIRTALTHYQRFISNYATSDYMPAALLNAARTLNAIDPQGSHDQIVNYLTRLKEEYPKSAESTAPDVDQLLGRAP